MYQYICKVCLLPFESCRKNRKYCSNKCVGIYNSGANSPHWKGGGINGYGYRRICVDGKRILEHRYIMEQHLGRKLESWEQIHHKNEDKLNNNIDNLVLVIDLEHKKFHATFRDEEKKQCSCCLIIKYRDNFYQSNKNENCDKNVSWCKKCYSENQQQRYQTKLARNI